MGQWRSLLPVNKSALADELAIYMLASHQVQSWAWEPGGVLDFGLINVKIA